MRGVTWLRESHGLFDYESRSIAKKSFKTETESRVMRVDKEIQLHPIFKNDKDIGLEAQSLCDLKKDSKGFYLKNMPLDASEDSEDSINRMWLVVRSLKDPEHGKMVNYAA